MKKIFLGVGGMACFFVLLSGRAGFGKTMFFHDVARGTAEAFCQKMEQCSKEKIPFVQCVNQMKDLFVQQNNDLPKTKKIELTEEELQACVQGIRQSTCLELKTSTQLKGCEFIQKLSGQ